jgi:hypothetical protein
VIQKHEKFYKRYLVYNFLEGLVELSLLVMLQLLRVGKSMNEMNEEIKRMILLLKLGKESLEKDVTSS